MKKNLILLILAFLATLSVQAQRFTDKLDRGLIAQKVSRGVLISWRINAEEYYDVSYFVYKNGSKLNSDPVTVSNYTDPSGTTSDSYAVAAVVKGVEQPACKAVTPWASSYKEVVLKHEGIASTLIPNDACCADVDGDGELEILMKFDNESEMAQSYPKNGPTVNGKVTGEYSIFEILKQDGKRLWWVNCGPNMGDFQNNEQNIVGYDWNEDGKAEVIMRLEEGSSIHYADGTTYTIGANGQNGGSWYNYRGATGGGTNWFMCVGKEFLVYCDGETGKVLDIIDYPLARLEPGETDLNSAWGDGYGHRASKFFFGAPYLDGKHPSIFLARGIYTQIKMCAFDVDKATNKLVKRWDWRQKNGGYWMWQGYHNFGIADVDMDGRDEICYGSMVVDDNGKGLSTTGLGHGDAQHHGDFDPYRHGLEIYACNEDQPGNNYRDATTSKIYHRFQSGNDDGRAMMDNFSDQFPGSIGCSAREGAISSVTGEYVEGMTTAGINTNFRIYWDGDLCSETFNYLNGKNTEGVVAKYGSWTPIYTAPGSMTNNDTKGTPCYQGDILGDWREEIIMRTADNNIRIYSTPTATSYRIPSLWADHQYRNAMVWQMCGYNQPPHVSYFLGKLEGITQAPPPLTMTGRDEVKNGGTIGASLNGKHAIVCESGNSSVTIAQGAEPGTLTFNVPSWVQGTAGTNYTSKDARIIYDYYTCDVQGAGISGTGRLVKQGDGILNLPKAEFTHSGETNIWGGIVNFDGTMKNSPVWLNRFAQLNSDGGAFKSLKADYAAVIRPGGEGKVGTIDAGEQLFLGFGSRLQIDLDGASCDKIVAKKVTLEEKTSDAWIKGGPEYLQPVIEVKGSMQAGDYVIAECETLTGRPLSVKIEGVEGFKTGLRYEDGKLILTLGSTRGKGQVVWTGVENGVWNYAETKNFAFVGDQAMTPEVFVNGDDVRFDDNGKTVAVVLNDKVSVDTLRFTNTLAKVYTLSGEGSITDGAFVKEAIGRVTIGTMNSYTGGNYLKGGTVSVSALSNDINPEGNLGAVTNNAAKFTFENGATLQSTAAVTNGSPIRMIGVAGGVINNSGDFVQQKAISGTRLTKKGTGWLKTNVANASLDTLELQAGTLEATGAAAKVVVLRTGTLNDLQSTSNNVSVTGTATWNTSHACTYSNKVTGNGTLSMVCALQKGSTWYATRTHIACNFSDFEGTLIPKCMYADDGRFTLDTGYGSSKMTMRIDKGVFVQNSGRTFPIGNLTGEGTLGGGCAFAQNVTVPANTWNVGNDKNFTFAGVFTSIDRFNKVGSGTMTVTGKWDNSGAITIKDGTLKITAGTASLGTAPLTIDAGGTLLAQTTTLKNSSITVNGTLQPGSMASSFTGTMKFNGQNVTVGSTGKINMRMNKVLTSETGTSSGTLLSGAGTITVNGTISVTLSTSLTPKVGDMFRIWDANTKYAGKATVVCENKLIKLDDSRLSEGIVTISKILVKGDANGDGLVSIGDANDIVNYFLGMAPKGFVFEAADVNGDGMITIDDANQVVNMFLGMQ